jgi:peroxin-5
MEEMFSRAWKDGELNESELDSAFKQMMSQAQTEGGYDYESSWGESMWEPPVSPLEQPYELETNNPYAKSNSAFDDGMKFFNAGNLHQAVLAFQAVVGNEPTHSDAWRMLGVVHQENDEDKKAIQCLERAVEHDAYNLDALLGLGVSYVNELDHANALKNLKAWVINNPAFVGLEVQKDEYSDGSMMDEVMQLMLKAAEWAPKDAGVHEVLGVLFNVTRDYSSASAAFRKAVDARPDDYSLWNKCGATLANSTPSRSEEAIPAYLRAIELRPGYARAHLNLGISYNNLGNFEAAARAYMKALELSPAATHIWQYIKISFTCMERPDLVTLCEAKDLNTLRKMFQ